jgi:murein DD-endopeptidase MepM/ murein hydrolase activator NlpD
MIEVGHGAPPTVPRASRATIAIGAAAVALLVGACAERRSDEGALRGLWVRLLPGDTLGALAARFHVSVEDLAALNAIPDADHVQAGTELFIPEAGTHPRGGAHRAKPRPAPTGIAALPALIGRGSSATTPGSIHLHLDWPVAATISSPFGERDGRPHDGVDLAVADGTPVRAAAAGQVVYAGDRLRGYGRMVVLRHDDHLVTIYGHNQKLLVAEGAAVAAGQVISLSGHSGRATAPHLHFEVRADGVALDPERLLPTLIADGSGPIHVRVAHH